MTTLADVNATLGATNIALSGVSKNQEETNKGINSFLDYLQDKDAADRRRQIEDDREKKASVLQRAGTGAAAAGRGLLSAGRATGGFLSNLFDKIKLPFAVGASFLSGILGAGLLKNAIRGIGVVFGDEIANFILGDRASKEIKEMVGGAISGAAIGSFFGPRFMLIGGLIGALSKDQKIREEGKKLYDSLDNLLKGFGGLEGIFKKIREGIGDGLKGINNLLKGNFDSDSIVDTLKLIGGAAALLMPGKMLGLLAAATRIMVTNPAGLALLAIAGGGMAINKLIGGEVTDPLGFGVSALTTGAAVYGGKKTMDAIRGNNKPKIDPKGNVSKLSKGSVPNARAGNPLTRMISTLTRGVGLSKLGLFTLGAATVMLPLAAIGLTEKYFGDEFRDEAEKDQFKKNVTKADVKMSKTGKNFFVGTTAFIDDFVSDGPKSGTAKGMNLDEELFKSKPDAFRKIQTNRLEEFFKRRAEETRLKTMDPVGNPTNVVNSGNTTNNVSNNQGLVLPKSKTNDASDPHALKTGSTSGMGLF